MSAKTKIALSLFTVLMCSVWAIAQEERPPKPPGVPAGPLGEPRPYHQRSGRPIVLAWADYRNTGPGGLQHDSVSHAMAVIERLGYESGAYDTYIRTDSNVISKHPVDTKGKPITASSLNLDQVDAIFFIGLREIELTDSQKKDLMSFIKDDGKGIVAAHAADTAFIDGQGASDYKGWPEWGKMMGGWFVQHPWYIVEAPVIVENPNFPGVKHLPAVFPLEEEYYETKDFSRDESDVILRLDTSKLSKTSIYDGKPLRQTDGDFPLAWAKNYGKGRVFYCALGHNTEEWDNPQVYRIYYEALRWALRQTNYEVKPHPLPAAAKPAAPAR